jgi:hypothetical protein
VPQEHLRLTALLLKGHARIRYLVSTLVLHDGNHFSLFFPDFFLLLQAMFPTHQIVVPKAGLFVSSIPQNEACLTKGSGAAKLRENALTPVLPCGGGYERR